MKPVQLGKKISIFFILFLFFLLIIHSFHIAYPLQVTHITTSGEFSVIGEGSVDVIPDTAYVNAGITVNNGESQNAVIATLNSTNNAIIAALQQLAIKRTAIKTTNYSVTPFVKGGLDSGPTVYNGNATLSIKLTDAAKVSQVIDAVTKAGANDIQQTQFVVENPNIYREQARQKAIANAKDQAQKLASMLGIQLGKIVNMSESSAQPPLSYNGLPMAASFSGGGSGPQVEPGSQTISSTVTLYYERQQ